ncbi:MAG: tetratricopeptide repeat protein [Planctomycetota bacterium]
MTPPPEPLAGGGGTSRDARRPLRLLLVAGAALFPVLAAEGICRLFGLGEPAPLYAPARGEDGTRLRRVSVVDGVPLAVTPEFVETKPAGRARVVYVGESTVAGIPFPPSVAFPARIETALRRAGLAAETLNASAPGLGVTGARRRTEEILGYDADLLVLYAGSNEFLPWNLFPGRERRTHPVRTRLRDLGGRLRLFQFLAPGDPNLGAERGYPYEASEEDRREARARCREEFPRLFEACRRAGVPLLVVLPAANLRDAVPKARRDFPDPDGRIARTQVEVLDRARAGDSRGALALLEASLREAPDHPVLHFGRGRLLLEEGRGEEARLAFERARDLDALPARMTGDIRAILEEACAGASVPWLDAQRVLEAADPTGIAGDDVFVDHVHPTAAGHLHLARAILRAIASEPGLAEPFPGRALQEAADRVEGARLTPEEEASARRTEALYLFPRAYATGSASGLGARVRGLLEEASSVARSDGVAALLLGLLEIRIGDAAGGRLRLRGALDRGALAEVEPALLNAIGETPDSIRALARR